MRALNIDIFSIIIFLGLVQGIFLSVLLISKSDPPNKILGIILLLISIQISDFFFAYTLISLRYPHLIDISLPLGLATGPLLYAFYYFIAEKKYPRYILVHLVPFGVFTFNQSFYYLQSADFKYNSFIYSRGLGLPLRQAGETFTSDPFDIRNLGGLFTTISLAIYTIPVFTELVKILKQSEVKNKKPGRGSVIWLRNLALLTLLLVVFVVINQISGGEPKSEYIVATGLTIIVYYSVYHFIRSSHMLNELSVTKYEKSTFPEEMKKVIKVRLITHMENDRPYLNNMFSLNQLSRNIMASPNHVSRIINEDLNQSYYDFISGYRIYEACKFLKDPGFKTLTMEDISFQVGYNSKAAFNKAFKKITGITPLLFKKNPEMYSPIGKHLISFEISNADSDRESPEH